ncbi:MAG: anti-sigma factor [Anaerolineaceae bacterium]
MNHQPFENMLLDEISLSQNEKEKLDQHLAVCPQCARLDNSLRTLGHEFKTAPVIEPPIGFSSRWQASLPARRQHKEREQTRIILLSMAATVAAACITLAAFLLPNISPITILAQLFADLVRLVSAITEFWSLVGSLFKAIPTGVSIGIVLTVSSWIGITLLAWGITLYKITWKGIRTTE